MWNDFVEGWGFRFEKKEKFPKFFMFVSEMKTWIEWHEKAAEQRLHLTAIAACGIGVIIGLGIGWFWFGA